MMSSERYAMIQEAVREEKRIQKHYLREALRMGNTTFVFQYCVGQQKQFKEAMLNQLVFGQGQIKVDENNARWVLRYYRRLMGRPVDGA